MKRITGKQVADALGWHYHDKPKESRRVMCDAAAETLNALAAACSYESAHMLLREARDLLEAAEFKESENAIAAQDVRERISIELGEWNADFEPNKSEGAPIRENGGRAETDTPPRTATPSDPSTAWTEDQRNAAASAWLANKYAGEGDEGTTAMCAEIAKHAHLFCGHGGIPSRDITKPVTPEEASREWSRDDVHRICLQTATVLRGQRTPTRQERDNLAMRLELVPRLNRDTNRTISAAELETLCEGYWNCVGGNRSPVVLWNESGKMGDWCRKDMRAALSKIGIEVKP